MYHTNTDVKKGNIVLINIFVYLTPKKLNMAGKSVTTQIKTNAETDNYLLYKRKTAIMTKS